MPRIRGAVRAMNHARARVAAGIPAAEQAAFRDAMRRLTEQIEAICQGHGVGPEALPAPSRRAYRYLLELQRVELPTPSASAAGPLGDSADAGGRIPTVPNPNAEADGPSRVAAPLRISGLVSMAEGLQAELQALAAPPPPRGANRRARREALQAQGGRSEARRSPEALQRWLRGELAAVRDLAASRGQSPADLPAASRRAYQWMAWLLEDDHLARQLACLERLQRRWRAPDHLRGLTSRERGRALWLRMVHGSRLLSSRPSAEAFELTLHVGFVDAPESLLATLLRAARSRSDPMALERMRAYAGGPEFAARLGELEAAGQDGATPVGRPQGAFHDLAASFDRVNTAYFEARMARPQLRWSQRPSTRRLGLYDTLSDTVRLSSSLDRAEVPTWFIDFVMYHELLHKQLGIERRGGRNHAHTPAFRQAERRFARYAEAQAFMLRLGSGID